MKDVKLIEIRCPVCGRKLLDKSSFVISVNIKIYEN